MLISTCRAAAPAWISGSILHNMAQGCRLIMDQGLFQGIGMHAGTAQGMPGVAALTASGRAEPQACLAAEATSCDALEEHMTKWFGQAMQLHPPPAYLYELPDSTLVEVQINLQLQFARSLKAGPCLPPPDC